MRFLFLSFFMPFFFALTACSGGGGGSSDNSNAVKTDTAVRFQGPANEPALIQQNFTYNDMPVELNSRTLGFIYDQERRSLSFEADKSGTVAIVLSSDAEDLDLEITSFDLQKYSYSFTSDEAVVFEAKAGTVYSIVITSFNGGGNYSLKVVQGNRESLGLRDNELYVLASGNGEESCIYGDGRREVYPFIATYDYIFNLETGALRFYSEVLDYDVEPEGTFEYYGWSEYPESLQGYRLYQYAAEQGFHGQEFWVYSYDGAVPEETVECMGEASFSADTLL